MVCPIRRDKLALVPKAPGSSSMAHVIHGAANQNAHHTHSTLHPKIPITQTNKIMGNWPTNNSN